jgi:hypothetical protein
LNERLPDGGPFSEKRFDTCNASISSFRGCPRTSRAEPGIQPLYHGDKNRIPGSIADEAGDRPGMTMGFFVVRALPEGAPCATRPQQPART